MLIEQFKYSTWLQVNETKAKLLEQIIELHLQPKPRWIPNFIWRRVIGKLLILKERPLKSNGKEIL
jgi:hypothetical protein